MRHELGKYMSQDNTGDGATIPELVIEELPEGVDDPIVLKAQLEKESQARRELTARAKKVEAELKEAKKALIKEEKPTHDGITKEYTLNDEVVDLRLDGYTKEDVSFIMKNGGRKSLEDKTSYVAIALNARKEQARAEAESNKVVDTTGMSEIERKYTPEMLKNMPLSELKKIVPRA